MAFVWHRTAEQTPNAPCLTHSPTLTAWLVQKAVEHVFLTLPLAAAFPPAPRVRFSALTLLLAPVDDISPCFFWLLLLNPCFLYRAAGTMAHRVRMAGSAPQTTVLRFLNPSPTL
jgi:hypothetical protein